MTEITIWTVCELRDISKEAASSTGEGLDGVVCVADDIVVYGCGDNADEATEDHDKKLVHVLKRCGKIGLKLSKEKAEIRKQSISFLGHEVNSEGLKVDEGKVKAITDLPL